MKSRRKTFSISQYDKIVKENLEAAIPALLKRLLHIYPVESEELPDDLQHTKERKPDALKRIRDADGKTFILHLEFQVADDPDMVYRMGDYCVMLARAYRLPIRQYVLFMGAKLPKMPTELNMGDSIIRYNLVSFHQFNSELFLTSDKPEEILFALLADYGTKSPEAILEHIVNRIYETTTGSLAFERYISQLRVLVQLRKLQPVLETVMEKLTQYFKEQEDPFYKKGERLGFSVGLENGRKQGIELVVSNLLRETALSISEIARLAEVPISFVEALKKELSA
ncbi:RpnC/YadD family protein [Spirosoma litoris]